MRRRRIYSRIPSSPQRGVNTYYRSVMDRARVANRRAGYYNNDYDHFNEEEGYAEDYARNRYWPGQGDENFERIEDELDDEFHGAYGGEDDYMRESGIRNYSENRERYGDVGRRNYIGRERTGYMYHMNDLDRQDWERRRNVPRGRRIRYT